jgi:hypothetical protein
MKYVQFWFYVALLFLSLYVVAVNALRLVCGWIDPPLPLPREGEDLFSGPVGILPRGTLASCSLVRTVVHLNILPESPGRPLESLRIDDVGSRRV